jgi:hypothetical protein
MIFKRAYLMDKIQSLKVYKYTLLDHRIFKKKNKKVFGQALVAHTCNPSYSGGRDQEDGGLRPVWVSSSQDSITKKGCGVAQVCLASVKH